MSNSREQLDKYITASIAAATRTRGAIIVGLSWSLLLVALLLNSAPGNWQSARMNKVLGVSRLVNQREKLLGTTVEQTLGLVAPDQLKTRLANWEKQKAEATSVDIPVVGLKVDVNDAGLVSALGLVIIFSWFLAAVRRELANLRIVFKEGGDSGFLKSTYLELSMYEVLHQPKLPREIESEKISFARGVLRTVASYLPLTTLASWTPFVVLAMYTGFDFNTFWVARFYNQEPRTIFMYFCEIAACIFLGFGAFAAINLFAKIRQEWETAYCEIFGRDEAALDVTSTPKLQQ